MASEKKYEKKTYRVEMSFLVEVSPWEDDKPPSRETVQRYLKQDLKQGGLAAELGRYMMNGVFEITKPAVFLHVVPEKPSAKKAKKGAKKCKALLARRTAMALSLASRPLRCASPFPRLSRCYDFSPTAQ